jgi:hypothetical protein
MMKAIFPKSHSKKESVDQAVHRLSDRAQVHGEQATTSAVGGHPQRDAITRGRMCSRA